MNICGWIQRLSQKITWQRTFTYPFIRTSVYSYKLQTNFTKKLFDWTQEASKTRTVDQIALLHSPSEVDQSPIIVTGQKSRNNVKAKFPWTRTYRTPKGGRKRANLMKLSKTQKRHEFPKPHLLKNNDRRWLSSPVMISSSWVKTK